jgi:oleate hydratase
MTPTNAPNRTAFLIGGGIASLASAAYLIHDGGFHGEQIHILEQSDAIGGSLDGHGSPETGYVMRGGRMFTDEAYTCTYDLLSFIPSLTDTSLTIRDEMAQFNQENISHSHSRLVAEGKPRDASRMGFSNRDRVDLIGLMAASEDSLGALRIEDYFERPFFKTDFWYLWCTTFAFQPWHSAVELKRYLHRFLQEFPRISTLAGVKRTPFNQYDSIVWPVSTWLREQGVRFVMNTVVTDLSFVNGAGGKRVETIRCSGGGKESEIAVKPEDLVFVTIGSMVAGSSAGSMTAPAACGVAEKCGSWKLWETLAARDQGFGRPAAFDSNIDESKWLSFTTTVRGPDFFSMMERFTGDKAGTGGLVTFTDSRWLMSVVLAHQPHFVRQPADVNVFWGYGLFPDEKGNYVDKKMCESSGAEIMTELCGHLRFDSAVAHILETSICIPCMMPYITSQFMPRVKGDRPAVRPVGTTNLAFIGQFCEIPDEVVFTVEYSVRSAQIAVYSLLGIDKEVSPIYNALLHPEVLFESAMAMAH